MGAKDISVGFRGVLSLVPWKIFESPRGRQLENKDRAECVKWINIGFVVVSFHQQCGVWEHIS